jgi:polysaccharide biosynthesis transport protein
MSIVEKEMMEAEDTHSKNAIDWFFVGFKRWKIFIGVFIVTLSLSSYYAYNKAITERPVYESMAKIMLAPANIEVKTKTGDTIERKYTIDDEIGFLQSKLVMQKAAGLLKTKYGYDISQETLEEELLEGLLVRGGRNLKKDIASAVEIAVVLDSPQKAFDAISAIIEAYKLQKAEEEKIFFEETFKTFQGQIDSAHSALLEAENKLADLIMKNEEAIKIIERYDLLVDVDESSSISSALNERILKTRDEISILNRFIDSIKTIFGKDLLATTSFIARKYPDLIDTELKDVLFEKESELDMALKVMEEAHPETLRIRDELDVIYKKIEKEILNALIEIEADIEELEEQEKELSFLAQKGLYRKLIEYGMLKKSVIIKRDTYNNLSKALYEIDLGEKLKHYTDVRILLPHKVPESPKGIGFAGNLFIAFMMSFLLGGVAVYAAEMMDTTIEDIEHLEQLVALPVLATIPLYRPAYDKKITMPKDKKSRLIINDDPSSPAAEAIRCLRTNILFLNPDFTNKVISFTSSIPGEGKSFLCANLGAAVAQSKKKTLLIDCDLRRKGLSNIFGMENAKGLYDALGKEKEYENILINDIPISSTNIDNLSLIPSGLYLHNPAELLSGVVLDKIIMLVKEKFDIVVVDLPPVLSVTDPLIVAKKSDSLVFTVGANVSKKKAILRTYNILKSGNVNIMGTVLNMADSGIGGYFRYKYRYGNNYGYYYKKDKQ